ncbi:MAG: hypothetical protein SNJ71_08750 [Bacteroidales bacterium]
MYKIENNFFKGDSNKDGIISLLEFFNFGAIDRSSTLDCIDLCLDDNGDRNYTTEFISSVRNNNDGCLAQFLSFCGIIENNIYPDVINITDKIITGNSEISGNIVKLKNVNFTDKHIHTIHTNTLELLNVNFGEQTTIIIDKNIPLCK